MSIMFHSRWLIVASCLAVTACTTEKTIIREVPASGSTDASSDTAVDNTLAPEKNGATNVTVTPDIGGNTAQNPEPDTGSNPGSSPMAPVINTPAPNMVEGTPTTGIQTPTTDTPSSGAPLVPTTSGDELLSDPVGTGVTGTGVTGAGADVTGTGVTGADVTGTDIPGTGVIGTDANGQGTGVTDTGTATQNFLLGDPAEPTTIGSPGMAVNCQMTLPCRWISSDTQFAVTVSNADNIGAQEHLSIEYSVLTAHDTEVLIASTEPAVDDAGLRYEPSALVLGEGVGGRAQGVVAGAAVPARIEFDGISTAASLTQWTISLSDAGLVRKPVFTNIPVGSATTQIADCANTLPCSWVAPDDSATITLNAVTGAGSTNRLSANFVVATKTNAIVAVDNGATAVGNDGIRYKARTHAIGLDTGATKLTANAIPGAQVAGTVYFFSTQTMSTALQNLSLVVYEDRPVPRWNPSFLSVPVQ